MATIKANKNKNGEVVGYRFRACIGRDEHFKQVWRSCTIPRPEGLTPKKEEKEVKRLADDWEKEQRDEYEKNKSKEAEEHRKEKNKITVPEFIERTWLTKHVNNGDHTPATVAFYMEMGENIKAYFLDRKPKTKLHDVNKEDVLDYLAYLRKEAKTRRGTPYSKTTIQHHFSTLRNIFEYAVYLDYVAENPCKKIKQSDKPKRGDHEIDFLDEEESIRFLACLDSEKELEYWKTNNGSALYWKALVNTFILTGLRRGELVGLQWRDIDKKNMLIHVRRNVTLEVPDKTEKDPEKKIHIGESKGKTIRESPITKYLLDLLLAHKAEQEKRFGGVLLPGAFVFCRSDNPYLPIYPTEPTRLMGKYVKRHNLPNMSPHDLRHTAGYLAKAGGADMKDIQALLGHKDPAMTQKFYVGITEKAQRKTIAGIEKILRPSEAETDSSETGEDAKEKAAK